MGRLNLSSQRWQKILASEEVTGAGMNAKTIVLLLVGLALASVHLAQAQQPKKTPRIGFLLAPSRSAVSESLDAFRQGLRDLGYIEGQNIVIEYRYAEGKFERLPDFAAELVRLKVDVIATGGSPAIQAAKDATRTIPIVMTGLTDPVAWGVIASLDRPGGNITGLSLGGYELIGKRLELLKETVPRLSRIAFFWTSHSPAPDLRSKETQSASRALALRIQSLEVGEANDFDVAFKAAVKGRAGGITVEPSPVFTTNRHRILAFAANNRLPGIYPWREYVEDGGLMSYAPNLSERYRRAAYYVDKILKGTKPADLPVEQPTKFEFIINLKTAKNIGLTIPQSVLYRADKVLK
jgi:putative ABC transport system substrate-binding protein